MFLAVHLVLLRLAGSGRIGLHDAEGRALGIGAIGEVALPQDRHLGPHNGAARRHDLFDVRVDRVDVDGVRRRLQRVAAVRKSAVDARFALARTDQSVRHWAIPLIDLPAEDLFVERDRALRIVRHQLEMHYTRHSLPSISRRFHRRHWLYYIVQMC